MGLVKYLTAQYISIGTVHSFQGSDRNIIIFSTVYGSYENCYFLNMNKHLLNVAVSRAKDAFWIFGARECLDSKGNSASAIVRRHVKDEILI